MKMSLAPGKMLIVSLQKLSKLEKMLRPPALNGNLLATRRDAVPYFCRKSCRPRPAAADWVVGAAERVHRNKLRTTGRGHR